MRPKDVTEGDMTVGARVAALRKARGVSQTVLSGALGVSFQQVGKYEQGHNRLSSSRLQEIAKFFDVPVSALFGDETETKGQISDFAPLNLLGAVELLKAFAAIENTQLRRDVLALARTAARISAGSVAGDA